MAFCSYSQTIEGVVIDDETEKPLVYANIALVTKNKGAITNDAGVFVLNLNEYDLNDSLLISYVGYKAKKISVSSLINLKKVIRLAEDINALDEVVLTSKEIKYSIPKTLGFNKKRTIETSVPFGYEKAVLIENKDNKPGRIKNVVFYVKEEEGQVYEAYAAYFRIKFYTYNKMSNSPENLLCYDDILVKPENKSQKIEVDVSKYNIPMPKEGVIVGLEVINPKITEPKTSMYTISPRLVMTQTKEAFSWSRVYGRPWNKNSRKSFVKNKFYISLMVNLKVEFVK